MEEKDILASFGALLSKMEPAEGMEAERLAQAGSDRRYYRLSANGHTYIGTYVPDAAEGRCFVDLARGFKAAGRPVPEVYAVSSDGRTYVQEDLGDRSLFSAISSGDAAVPVMQTLSRLVSLQKSPEPLWKDLCVASPFCRRQVMWDLNYFKYEFLKPKEVIFDEDALEDDFEHLAERLVSVPGCFRGFMMRDCQSRNVMLTESGPFFIDFQGGRFGPALYDAVSLLWQARAGFDSMFRSEMLDYYCGVYCGGDEVKKSEMLSDVDDMVLFRTLQVLGAYGFRGLVQHKAHFVLSIPGALANLRELLEAGALDRYPELKKCATLLTVNKSREAALSAPGLTVEIFSFSYKKGYPSDMSGNGGGFMFDCRALHNPGRYQKYRSLTGRDKEVADFLEERGEVHAFLKNAWSLTDAAIERYISRGFTNIQIGFGCTGGQHRSVYCAERTAAHVGATFPEASVRLIHREHP